MKVFSVKKLKDLLSDPRYHQAGIAESAGISRQTLYDIRDGRKHPKANTLFAIAWVLGKPADYFSEDVADATVLQQKLALREERKARKKEGDAPEAKSIRGRKGVANE